MGPRAFLLAAALFLASCRKEKQVEPVIQVVRAGVVEEIRPGVEERYSVSLEPFDKVDLAFKSGGIVQGILQVRGADGRMRNVQAGDKVARNAELAQVRPLDCQHALEQAEAQHAQAQAQLAHAQAELAQARAHQLEKARSCFDKLLCHANHLGLFSEQVGRDGRQLGNFPQALTHLALVSAAISLDRGLSGTPTEPWS